MHAKSLGVALVVTFALASAACLEAEVTSCADGALCPPGTVCDDDFGCLLQDQIDACAGDPDGAACSYPGVTDGRCASEVCLPAGCNDGFRDDTEVCDGDDLGGETCATQGFYRGELTCSASCRLDLSGCAGTCGDGFADTDDGEECDGADLDDETCASLGFYAGELACLSNCQRSLVGCAGLCGDGARSGDEVCDGNDFGGEGCSDHGFYTGLLACTDTCDGVTTTECSGTCGDDTKNGPELCDGTDLGGFSCASLGYYAGTPACASTCDGAVAGTCAGYCGDGQVTGNELCDGGAQLANATCTSFGSDFGTLGCDGRCQRTFTSCFQAGAWTTSAVADTFTLTAIDGRAEDDVWVVGPDGYISRWDGNTWLDVPSPSNIAFYTGIDLGPGDTALIVSSNEVLRGSSAGVAVEYGVGTAYLHDVASHDASGTAWIVGGEGLVGLTWFYDGDSWSPEAVPAETDMLEAVWVAPDGDAWAVGQLGTILRHDGVAWVEDRAPGVFAPLRDVWGTSSTDVWVVGDQGTVLHRDASGWTTVDAGAVFDLSAVAGSSPTDVWAFGSVGVAYHFDGASWRQQGASSEAAQFQGGWAARPSYVLAVTSTGGILRYRGPGWHAVPSGTTAQLLEIHGTGPDDVWAVGNGAIVHFDGDTWTEQAMTGSFTGVHAIAPDDAVAVDFYGRVLEWDGVSWAEVPEAASASYLEAVWASGPDDVWVVGYDGTVLHRGAGGWTTIDTGIDEHFGDVWGDGEGDLWITTLDAVIVHYDGLTWTTIESGFFGFNVWGTAPSDLWFGAGPARYHSHGDGVFDRIEGHEGGGNLFGSGPSDVWSVSGSLIHYDGARWTPATVPSGVFVTNGWSASRDDAWLVGSDGTILRYAAEPSAVDGGACAQPIPLWCGDPDERRTGSTTGGATGVSYVFDVPVTGAVTIELTPYDADLELVAYGAAGDATCDPSTPVASSDAGALAVETIELDTTAGERVYVVVDSATSAPSAYDLRVTCVKE